MKISLLITTQNNYSDIDRLLNSLAKQQKKNFTVVLGLQAPDTKMLSIIDKYLTLLPVRIYRLSICSLSKARNTLLKYCDGDIIGFPDDDCYYFTDTTKEIANAFATNHKMDICIAKGVSGLYLSEKIFFPSKRVNCYTVLKNSPSWTLFFRHATVKRTGSFDEKMGLGAPTPWQSGEETDFVLRAMRDGASVSRVESVQVLHPPHKNTFQMAPKWRGYGAGRIYLLNKHNFPLWFVFLNVIYPLVSMLTEPFSSWRYRLTMFTSRLYYMVRLYILRKKL